MLGDVNMLCVLVEYGDCINRGGGCIGDNGAVIAAADCVSTKRLVRVSSSGEEYSVGLIGAKDADGQDVLRIMRCGASPCNRR